MLRCGLIGEHLGHSYSPQIHRQMGDYEYALYELTEGEVAPFLKKGAWDGLNVTIPYKKTVLPFCDRLSPRAKQIGGVNTLTRLPNGEIFGDNTDPFGFDALLNMHGICAAGKKVLILGSGGASLTVSYVLQKLGAKSVVISRKGPDHYQNLFLHRDAKIIVNATPVGMYPQNGESLVNLDDFPCCEAVVDLIYNPARTALLLQARQRKIVFANGLTMLVTQAGKSSEQFTGNPVSREKVLQITKSLSHDMENLVLVGMPGCGKTSIGKMLASLTQREFLDTDMLFYQHMGVSPGAFISGHGEEAFRRIETQILGEIGKLSGKIIATGGGCITRPENEGFLRQNGSIVWLKRDLSMLCRENRPLSQGNLESLAQRRYPLYKQFSDFEIENHGAMEAVAQNLIGAWNENTCHQWAQPESFGSAGAGYLRPENLQGSAGIYSERL